MESEEDIEQQAYEWLRSHLTGFLRFDGERVALTCAPLPDGRFVAPVMVAMQIAADTVLELPDDGEEDLHLMVSLEKFDERLETTGAADRWRIYHGDPPDVNWAFITIDASKFRGYFFDGEVFHRPNTLENGGAPISRLLNQSNLDLVRAALKRQLQSEFEMPIVVGVDQDGLDVRGKFAVVRLKAPTAGMITNHATAVQVLTTLAGDAPPTR